MHLLRRCLLALFLLVSAPASAAGDADWLYRGSDIERDPNWIFGTLPNGLRYAVRQNKLPVGQVSIRLRIDAGSLHEADQERGWAHFVEHMAFRGTRDFADREARHVWQKLGASFGSDTNAFTSPTQTVYQLDLPNADASEIDLSLDVIAGMADNALFDPATVEAEKKVILAEKGRRPELTNRYIETSWPLFYAGLKIAERDTIGTEPTLRAATAEGLRGFYERWYRPDRATLIIVGDADPKALEAIIAKHFSRWQASGPKPAEPDFGTIARTPQRTAALAYPGTPHSASLLWLRPYQDLPDTKAHEQADMARALAARIINRRLEAKARGDAAFVSAGLGESRQAGIADTTQLSLTARGGKWREAMTESFAILADALRAPPSETEISREIQNLRTAYTSAVEGVGTVKSPQWAQQLVGAIDADSIVASPQTSLALLEEFAPGMTPAAIAAATRALLTGEGPRLVLAGPEPVPAPAVEAALAAAQKAPPATRQADRKVSMDALPPIGGEGREVARRRIEDMGVTIVEFANGSTLTFKQTDFEKGSVAVQLRFGAGLAGQRPDRPSLAWLSGAVVPSGVAELDLDGLERLLTGRKMGINFGVDEDAFVLSGRTNGTDLGDELRLLASKLAFPRWDGSVVERIKTSAVESYDLAFASAAARAGREFSGFARPNDARWAPVEKAQIAAATPAQFEAFFAPLMGAGPVQAIIVGDVDVENAVAAMKKSIAALPARPPVRVPEAHRAVAPPKPNSSPATFTHVGDKDQAFALIGWTTFGGTDRIRERRALVMAAHLLQVRLFERLREAEGSSYSPSAVSTTSQDYRDWGIFYAASELRPESADDFFRIAREIVADLAAKPAAEDEYARARNPILSGIERRVKTNGYWLESMEDWISQPELIEQTRSYYADYEALTAEDVRAAVAKHVCDAGDWSMLVVPGRPAAAPTAAPR
jgi:zinc protease